MKKLLSKKTKKKDTKQVPEKKPIVLLYKFLNLVLPIGLLLLIRVDLAPLAVMLVLFSKWRVFAVKPRHMLANLRSNSVDIIVKVSTLAFMIEAGTLEEQLIWTAWYILWLVLIKPASSRAWMTFQAGAAHFLGVSSVLLFSNSINMAVILLVIWFVALSSARHFFSSYEEPRTQVMSHIWALFALQLGWVLSNWLLVYVFVPQLIFILGVVGYALGSLYNAKQNDALKPAFIRQQAGMTVIVLLLIILIADWQGNV